MDCTVAVCGDETINAIAGESCDDGNAITEACAYGLDACTVCAADCTEQPGRFMSVERCAGSGRSL